MKIQVKRIHERILTELALEEDWIYGLEIYLRIFGSSPSSYHVFDMALKQLEAAECISSIWEGEEPRRKLYTLNGAVNEALRESKYFQWRLEASGHNWEIHKGDWVDRIVRLPIFKSYRINRFMKAHADPNRAPKLTDEYYEWYLQGIRLGEL